HRPFLDGWRAWATQAGGNLGKRFAFDYPTAGANEGIHALLAMFATHGGRRIHVFEGEYEGYGHPGRGLALDVVTHVREEEAYRQSLADVRPELDLVFLSE